ncbi:MAG: tetratricopeptide repeat protein, partial [Bacteroidota bacterium]
LYKNRGNLHLLFGAHFKAIADYTKAIQLDDQFAEAYFNRGLANFLAYNKIAGCSDLSQSEALGFERATEKRRYFCSP